MRLSEEELDYYADKFVEAKKFHEIKFDYPFPYNLVQFIERRREMMEALRGNTIVWLKGERRKNVQ